MQALFKKSLFIFRRDLRINDNTAFNKALEMSEIVIPCFIFDNRQIGEKNKYRSLHSIQFMIESLQELNQALHEQGGKLFTFNGIAEEVVENLIKEKKINAVFCNRDYTPFSNKRDTAIYKICHEHNVSFESCNDVLLFDPEEVKTLQGTPYTVFTAFYKKTKNFKIPKPTTHAIDSLYKGTINNTVSLNEMYKKIIKKKFTMLGEKPGRQAAIKILNTIETFKTYNTTHNICGTSTTHLSAHLKFGTISIREAWHFIHNKLKNKAEPLLRQLYWRDFFTYISHHFPHVYGHAFRKKYDNLFWNKKDATFKAWCEGKTGFPLVDAGMREMNATGYMHNRARLVTGSFLVKDLHLDWKLGEQYFANQLVDYDPALNNGNWQWVASTGCDAQPFFRIFNPWTQQKKFDPDCSYIKKWVPELQSYKPSIIHGLYKPDALAIPGYPKPIVDHGKASEYAKKLYRKK